MSRRTVVALVLGLALVSCRRETSPPPIVIRYAGVNTDTEEIINDRIGGLRKYELLKDGAKVLTRKGREYHFQRLPNPGYRGSDDVLTLALSAQTDATRPSAGLYFVDLYWFKTFEPEWLVPFEGERWRASEFKEDFIKICYLGDGAERQLYAIPFSAKGNVLFYRRDLLRLLGDAKPPATWDDLVRQVERFRALAGTEPAVRKLKYGLLFHWKNLANDFYPIMWGFGGDIFSADEAKRRSAVEALYMLKSLVHLGKDARIPFTPSAEELEERFGREGSRLHQCFAKGEAVFMINWDNRLDKMRKYEHATVAPQQVGVAPIPRGAEEVSASNIGSWGWVISARPEQEDPWTTGKEVIAAIQEFVNDLTSADAQEWLAANHGYIPSRKIPLSEKARKRIAELGPGTEEVFSVFADTGRVRFLDRPHSKRVNDIVEYGLKEAILAPFIDGDLERKSLTRRLDAVRRRAQVFLSE
ncbi:MAG: extracellular solute-binding protein [Planctomycetes bacterium]|nr:extracellular solute-binding protein [Planctomycetota bacterium]